MTTYRLDRNLVVKMGESHWSVQRILDERYVQLENVSTGRVRKHRISKLCNDIANGDVSVVSGKNLTYPGTGADNRTAIVCPDSLPEQHRAAFVRTHDYVRAMRKRGISKGQRKRIAEAILGSRGRCNT